MVPAIPPAIAQARLQQTAAGLLISIPVRRSWAESLEMLVLAGAAFVALCRIERLPQFWTFALTFLFIACFAKWMWRALGRQLVTINKAALRIRYDLAALRIRYDLLGLGWSQEYFAARIFKLRYARFVTPADITRGLDNSPSFGGLCFDYGDETVRLRGRFSEEEAQTLMALIEEQCGASLTGLKITVAHSRGGGLIEESHRGVGGMLLFSWLGGVPYSLVMFAESHPLRVAAGVLWAMLVGMGIVAESGYRYRFTRAGLEIRALRLRLKFIPLEQILHYEAAAWTSADGRNIPFLPGQRCFNWGGPGVRISTLDGPVYIGHKWPEKIVGELDRMKGMPSTASFAASGSG